MTDAGIGGNHWSMWIGETQWKGTPGEFEFGQHGMAYPIDGTNKFIFHPTFGFGFQSAQEFRVRCTTESFLVVATRGNVDDNPDAGAKPRALFEMDGQSSWLESDADDLENA
ncbi:MAG: hypothetical protein AVDCRST_MAG93-8056 [uncultured Chloroflexia bacterium]|uniref:Uncharacterized protein n=1 Tax=uncultured Chloroflexia bacterium TaxID=1672391 RepID=A0A6J4MRT2_9CHLR|nr:MAG: hypothetical protein AVDCRST_MAG93-8056 [uncultured Chloroflexia bacterium]